MRSGARPRAVAICWGVSASVAMAALYLGVMLLTMRSFEAVWSFFVPYWFAIAGILLGFGAQVGLWVWVRGLARDRRGHHGAVAGVSGVVSGSAMVACCAHHLTDLFPVLGFGGAALLVTRYQGPILWLGFSVTLLGVAWMLHVLARVRGRVDRSVRTYQAESSE